MQKTVNVSFCYVGATELEEVPSSRRIPVDAISKRQNALQEKNRRAQKRYRERRKASDCAMIPTVDAFM